MVPNNVDSELKKIIKEAAFLLLLYWDKPIQKNKKENGSIVTQADIESEKLLIERLSALMPQADFWSEESGQSGAKDTGYRWVIDPLDGTRNFAYKIPYFCISVALTYHDEPILAVIYNPIQDELFFAKKGEGAYCNDQKIAVSDPQTFKECFIAFGLSYATKHRPEMIKAAQKLVGRVAAVRHMGAIALDMANTAMGRFDGVMFTHLSWWDVAAGILIIEEAGGVVRQINGEPLGPDYTTCLAGSTFVFERLQGLFDPLI
jgi:myo-inositol-1(or 4)-monophosphatase